MIDFATLQGLTIPEGVVKQIADASGRVLWKKEPATATITLNGKGNGWYHYVKHNSTIYSNATNTPSFQANIGDVIVCHCMLSGGEMSIYLNGILVAGKTGGTTAVDYSYTVVSDATIELAQSDEYRRIYITEIPEGHALLSIDYSNPEQFSTSVDGVSYNDTTITVPIGSVVEISAFNLSCYKKCSYGSASVYINDNLVASESEIIDYSYTVRGNTAITSYVNPSYCRDCDNYAYDAIINITETPVTFTINGTQYSAYPSMTWNDWNDSDFNTSGQKVASVVDASGNSVSLDAVIVGGTAYEVGFAKPVTITVTGTGLDDYVYIIHAEGGYTRYTSPTTFTANVGDTIHCYCTECWGGYPTTYIRVNDLTMVYTNDEDDISYYYTVVSDATINLYVNYASTKRDRVGQIDIYDGNA